MDIKRKELCPLLKKKCIRQDCVWFIKLAGTDPQDASKHIEEWDCAMVWQIRGQLEVAKRVAAAGDGMQSAHESFRNEFVKAASNAIAAQQQNYLPRI